MLISRAFQVVQSLYMTQIDLCILIASFHMCIPLSFQKKIPKKMATEKKQHTLGFAENFGLSGAAAVISKTAAAPIERVKLLVQNQDEMLKAGRITEPYKGVIDCTLRTYRTEGE